MRSEGAIRHKLKQVRFRHLKKLLEKNLRRVPENCVYNREVSCPSTTIRVCIYPDQIEGQNLCDSQLGGHQKVQGCSWFLAAKSRETLKTEFKEWISTSSHGEIALRYPDMAALMWVIGDPVFDSDMEEGFSLEGPTDKDPELQEKASLRSPPYSWWHRLWGRILG